MSIQKLRRVTRAGQPGLLCLGLTLFPQVAHAAQADDTKPTPSAPPAHASDGEAAVPVEPEEPEEEAEPSAQKNLPELVVTPTRYPESRFDIPNSVNLVTEKDMAEKMPRTPAEALRRTPGVWVQQTGHIGGAPILRGFMGNRVTYLFDGIRRNTAGLFGGPNSFLQNIDALDVERIEVVKGPGSVLHGSDAIGGVINVISNEKPKFSDELESGGRLYTRYASVDREMSARAEGFVSGEDFYAFVGGTYRDIDHLQGGRGRGLQDPSGWREKNFDVQFNYRVDDDSEVEFFVQDLSRPTAARYDKPNRLSSTDRELYGARYTTRDLGFVDDLEITGYFHKQERFTDEVHWDSSGSDETLGAEIQGTSFVGDNVRLVYGLHYHEDDVVGSDPQNQKADPDVTWENPAAYLLSEWQVTDRLRVDVGARWDSFNLQSTSPGFAKLDAEIQEAITSGALSESDLELDASDQALTGGLGFVYDVTDTTSLVANVGHAFRAPNKNDLLSFGEFTFGFRVPSTDVDPESSWTYELGIREENENFAGSITGFYTEVDNAIISTPGTFNGADYIDVNGNSTHDAGEDVYVKTNSDGTVRALGVDVEVRHWLPTSWSRALVGQHDLSWYGNFSWIWGEDTGEDEPLDRAYPANGLLGLRIDDSRDANVSKWWGEAELWLVRDFHRIPSGRKASDGAYKNDPADSSSGLLGGDGNLPGFGVLNVRGGRNIGKDAQLFVGVNNLGNRNYRVKDSRIDSAGLGIVVGLNINF